MTKTMICILCPRGCTLEAKKEGENWLVAGNGCPRGKAYALQELTHPVRTVTAVIRVSNREDVMLSVKTREPIPKDKVMPLMEILRSRTVEAPVKMGEVILEDAFGSAVVATKDLP